MSWISGLAVYFIVWWVVLFTVLPVGVRSAHELGEEVESGHAPSAPVSPRLLWKFLATTLISGVIFACIYVVRTYKLITLDSLPF